MDFMRHLLTEKRHFKLALLKCLKSCIWAIFQNFLFNPRICIEQFVTIIFFFFMKWIKKYMYFQVAREAYSSQSSWWTRSYSNTAKSYCKRSRACLITITARQCRCRRTNDLVTTWNKCRSMRQARITLVVRFLKQWTIRVQSLRGSCSIHHWMTIGHLRNPVVDSQS